jgi:hypothetical protein
MGYVVYEAALWRASRDVWKTDKEKAAAKRKQRISSGFQGEEVSL